MKIVIWFVTLTIAFVAAAEKLSQLEEDKLFGDYLKRFNLRSSRSNQQQANFLRNFYSVEEHNEGYRNGSKSYNQTINKFSHLDQQEFLRTHTGYIPGSLNATISPLSNLRRGRLATPSSWSWLDKPNAVGPVTNQGGCGSCTIFATIGAIESHMRIWYGIDTKLSEQEAMQCCGGCDGGTNSYIYDYAKNGGTYESGFKYVAKVLEPCNTKRARVPGSKVQSYYRIADDANAVKNGMWHLVNVGPLATGLCLPGRSFQSYSSGVYDDEDWSDCGWHAVLVVGFGTENGKDYWLVRNSWGPEWGDKGYFKIARGNNLCNLEADLTFPILEW